jgi:type I restriction enzyme R subunit
MSNSPSFKEEYISQLPALQLLMQLGFTYLTPDEALALRGGTLRNVVLLEVLREWLKSHNAIRYRGQPYAFSEANIRLATSQLTNEPYDGLIRTNEKVYELLTLGTTLTQTIAGDSKSYSLKYIDWQHPQNNVYHVTDEYSVERSRSKKRRRPDIVCFVNGIPLVVIECKRPDQSSQGERAVWEGVSQMIRNQRDEEIPHLFVFSQLLLSISTNDATYATTGTPRRFWSLWREERAEVLQSAIQAAINAPLSTADKQKLYHHHQRENGYGVESYFDELRAGGERWATEQDKTLYYLLRPERLLELVHRFIVYDGGMKKIARYQQYFAVKATAQRVVKLHAGKRTGGIIWHTTGSGKSLTMVMLAKVLSLHPAILNPKVILVTDRIDLDNQLYGTFKACGKKIVQAKSGKHLIDLVQGSRADIIATVIDKFETVANQKVRDKNPNIFVLVDESHRSQYGIIHAKMRRVFPLACYIGFTGTPLLKKEKTTAAKFGDFIHTYPMRQAVADKAVVPLIYEGRMVELSPEQASIDRWFERVTKKLSAEQKRDLKRKLSRQGEVQQAEQRIQQIAYDISEHYVANFQGQGFKAQLAVPKKRVALKYKEALDEFGDVTCAVVISAPDSREGHETVDEANLPKLQAFWRQMMAQYGSEQAYNREIKASFSRCDGIEILIVVDKLLTGFDEPRNTVLYIDKPLKEHGLLQAIARVNRLFEGKDHGYIVDYRGVLGRLNEALNTYDALADFDSQDVAGTIVDVTQILNRLPQRHANLWAVFRPVANKKDTEQLERFLEPEDRRQEFYEALSAYAKALQVALSTVQFYDQVSEARISSYKDDLTFFHHLRESVKQRYAETIEYKIYEQKIRKLMDRHISASYVLSLTKQVNIFDVESFQNEVEKIEGSAARADRIAYEMKRTIALRMEEDPTFYKSFSDLIEETITAYKQGRLDDADYLARVSQHYQQFVSGRTNTLPAKLNAHKHARAYYGILLEAISHHAPAAIEPIDSTELGADMAIRIEEMIEEHKIRDWTGNIDIQNRMKDDLEDYLFRIKGRYNVAFSGDEIDMLLDQLIHTAKQRNNL